MERLVTMQNKQKTISFRLKLQWIQKTSKRDEYVKYVIFPFSWISKQLYEYKPHLTFIMFTSHSYLFFPSYENPIYIFISLIKLQNSRTFFLLKSQKFTHSITNATQSNNNLFIHLIKKYDRALCCICHECINDKFNLFNLIAV